MSGIKDEVEKVTSSEEEGKEVTSTTNNYSENDKNYSTPAFTNYNKRGQHSNNGVKEKGPPPPPVSQASPTCVLQKSSFSLRPSKLVNPVVSTPEITVTEPISLPILRPPRLLTATTTTPPPLNNVVVPEKVEKDEPIQFVPLVNVNNKSPNNTTTNKQATNNDDFLFGQNLHQRVVKSDVVAVETVASVQPTTTRKRKLDDAEDDVLTTGEEDEANVLQIGVKLFTYNKDSLTSWNERGRGELRLNDKNVGSKLESRLIIRTKGSLRVMLNTKVWTGMVVEKPNEKSVRFTGFDDDGQVKIFLVMAGSGDMELLFNALEFRKKNLVSEGAD